MVRGAEPGAATRRSAARGVEHSVISLRSMRRDAPRYEASRGEATRGNATRRVEHAKVVWVVRSVRCATSPGDASRRGAMQRSAARRVDVKKLGLASSTAGAMLSVASLRGARRGVASRSRVFKAFLRRSARCPSSRTSPGGTRRCRLTRQLGRTCSRSACRS